MIQATAGYYLSRIAKLEKELELAKLKIGALESEAHWNNARIMALRHDLERAQNKFVGKD